MDEENEEQTTSDDLDINSQKNENSNQVSQKVSQVKDRAQQISNMAKKISKKANAGAAKVGKVVAQIASKLGPVLPWIALAIVIIFVAVGICGFLATMPGLLTGNLKQMAQSVADWWQEGYKTGADASVNEDDVEKAAEYIRSMGYDLIGYGFIPANDEIDLSGKITINEAGKYVDDAGNEVTSPGTYYDKYGIGYTTGGDNEGAKGTFETAGIITDFLDYNTDARKSVPDVSRLRTYLLADARMFHIRNYDDTETFAGWLHDIFLNNDEDWSKGLISLYKAEDYIAKSAYSKTEAGYIKINPASKQMEVKVGWNTNSMKFQMDGWSGRYGLTLEFLLSLHLGTMAPELVSTIARTFDTEVQVYLDAYTTDVTAYYKDENTPDYFTWDDMDQKLKDYHGNSDGVGVLGNEEAKVIMEEYGLKSQKDGEFKCNYGAMNFVKFLNGEVTDKEDIFSDIEASESSSYYIQNVVEGKGASLADDYPEIINSTSWSDLNTVDSGETDRCNRSVNNSLDYVISCINSSITHMKSNYSAWINISDSTKKVSDYSTTYALTGGDAELEDIVPYNEFKTLRGIKEYKICSFKGTEANVEDQRTLVLSLFIARTSVDHNWDFSVVLYEIPSQNEKDSGETCSDNFDKIEKVCTPCEKYVETIRDALNAIKEEDFKSYTPYIARVVDSWFRDTYFVIPDDGVSDVAINGVYGNPAKKNDYGDGSGQIKLTGNDIEFIDVDNEYLEETDEYWTKYETTTNSKGENVYVLYELDSDGTLTSNKYIRDINEEGKEIYKNLITGVTELVENSNLKLVKKQAVAKDEDGNEIKITHNWEQNAAGNVWTVYKSGNVSGNGAKETLEVNDDSDDDIKKIAEYTGGDNYKKYFYYEMDTTATVEQKEDARRGITNPTIKQMFKIRKYYIYDGTEEKAKAIYDDWQDVIADYGSICLVYYQNDDFFKAKYQNSSNNTERAVELALDDFYYYGTGPLTSDPRNSSLIGNIKINKDTLNSFSILENTHTLDADYQYRDFKELIVELDYFDKEDLSDKPEEVFEWIIPEYSEKWPIRLIDKSEEFYGTLVHSDLAVTKLKADLGIEEPDPDAEAVADAATTEDEKILEISKSTGYTTGLDVISPVTGEVINYGTYKRINTDFINAKSKENNTKETAATLEDKGVNVEEEVGFIQIKVLDKEAKDALVAACGSNVISVEYEGSNENIDESEAWGGFYKEYEGVCEGYIITIEGIELLYNGTDALSQLISNASSIQAADIQAKTTPNLANNDQEEKNQKIENAKVKLDAAKVVGGKLYIREGAIIGKTTYSTTPEFENYSYIRLILRNEKLKLIENVEDYFDLPESMRGETQNYGNQDMDFSTDDISALAIGIHAETCATFMQSFGYSEEEALKIAKTTGYVIINNALRTDKTVYGILTHYPTYATQTNQKVATKNTAVNSCAKCMEAAEWCTKYDCSSITNSSGEPMSKRNIFQAGFCQCGSEDSNHWWYVPTGSGYDNIYFCRANEAHANY